MYHIYSFQKKKKNTALVRGYAEVQRPCISFILNNFLLTEACFNVYRYVAVTYFSTIVFVCASWWLNEINYYYFVQHNCAICCMLG